MLNAIVYLLVAFGVSVVSLALVIRLVRQLRAAEYRIALERANHAMTKGDLRISHNTVAYYRDEVIRLRRAMKRSNNDVLELLDKIKGDRQ